MAVQKLSQIPAASASPALTDQLVGVAGGTTDQLYTVTQVNAANLAASNLTFQVATTGSDSNPGTVGSPFLTIQHALNVVATYNWSNGFAPVINIANGTYTQSSPINVPELQGLVTGVQGAIVGNAGSPGSVVVKVTGGGNVFQGSGDGCRWSFSGLQTDGTGGHFKANNFAHWNISACNINDSVSTGAGVQPFWGTYYAQLTVSGTINYLPANCLIFCTGTFGPRLSFSGTLVFPVGGCLFHSQFFSISDNVEVLWQGITVTNQNALTSTSSPEGTLTAGNGCSIYTANGFFTDLPFGTEDPTCVQTADGSFQLVGSTNGTANVLGAVSELGFLYRTIWPVNAPHTLKSFEVGSIVEVSSAGAGTFTLPANANLYLPPGAEITIVQSGAGAITLTPDTGVTINGTTVTTGQWTSLHAYKRDLGRSTPSDTWVAVPSL